ncbi:hypothetical protein X975_02713, partial [Stegodyphus mimosarum]
MHAAMQFKACQCDACMLVICTHTFFYPTNIIAFFLYKVCQFFLESTSCWKGYSYLLFISIFTASNISCFILVISFLISTMISCLIFSISETSRTI